MKSDNEKFGNIINGIETGIFVSCSYILGCVALDIIKNKGATKITPSSLIHTPAIALGPITGAVMGYNKKPNSDELSSSNLKGDSTFWGKN